MTDAIRFSRVTHPAADGGTVMAKRKRPPVTLHAHPVLSPTSSVAELDLIIGYALREEELDPDEYHDYTGACLSLAAPMAAALREAWAREDALVTAMRADDIGWHVDAEDAIVAAHDARREAQP